MRIAQAAKELGVPAETLRYYEKAGLFARVTRGNGGARDYSAEELEEARRIAELRRGGVSIEDLRHLRSLSSLGDRAGAAKFLDLKIEECHERADAARIAARILREESRKWA